MFRLSPQLLIATTRALAGLGVTEEDFGEADDGAQHQGRVLGIVQDDRSSWDARFVQQCGYWSHYNHRSRSSMWPIPVDLTTPELALFGLAHGVLHDTPEPGDVFLMWGPSRDMFVHAGVVVDVLATYPEPGRKRSFDVYAIEGDTDEYGRLRGGRAMRVRRRLSAARGDRFLRWAELVSEGTRRSRCGSRCA